MRDYVYEDFASDTFEVFRVISESTLKEDPDAISALVNIFNESSDSIIAYLKVHPTT